MNNVIFGIAAAFWLLRLRVCCTCNCWLELFGCWYLPVPRLSGLHDTNDVRKPLSYKNGLYLIRFPILFHRGHFLSISRFSTYEEISPT